MLWLYYNHELEFFFYKTMAFRLLPQYWLHVYTDKSTKGVNRFVEAGVSCRDLQLLALVGYRL